MVSEQSQVRRLRDMARRIFRAAIEAADPRPMVQRLISVDGRTVAVDGRRFTLGEPAGRVLVLAAGKAAVPMAHAAELRLGPLIHDGLAVTNQNRGPGLDRVPVVLAGHPLPDHRSATAAERMLQLAGTANRGDLVICLLSGGASALLTAPAAPLGLRHLREITGLLIECGADIGQVNCVRKHLSAIKGGRLARAVWPSALVTLLLSDVVGDRADVIASGPTVPDPSSFQEALSILEGYGLLHSAPAVVVQRIRCGASGGIEETPGPGDPIFHRTLVRTVGSNRDAMAGAADEASRLGFRVVVRSVPVTGEAARAAAGIARQARPGSASGPLCFISGGETTVTLPIRHGLGGRNMELALAAAPFLADDPAAVLLSAGTDGTDGPTDAAGALADSSTMDRAEKAGLDHRTAMRQHDSYPFFQALGDLVITGPIGTNLMDLQILLVDRRTDQRE